MKKYLFLMICLVGISFSAKAQFYGGYYGGGFYANQLEQQLFQMRMMTQQMQIQNMQMQMQSQQGPWMQSTTQEQLQNMARNFQEQMIENAKNHVNVDQEQFSYEQSSSDNSSNNSSTVKLRSKKTCGLCGGKGWIPNNTRVASFGISEPKWCAECNKTVPTTHYHETCPSCKGKGEW